MKRWRWYLLAATFARGVACYSASPLRAWRSSAQWAGLMRTGPEKSGASDSSGLFKEPGRTLSLRFRLTRRRGRAHRKSARVASPDPTPDPENITHQLSL